MTLFCSRPGLKSTTFFTTRFICLLYRSYSSSGRPQNFVFFSSITTRPYCASSLWTIPFHNSAALFGSFLSIFWIFSSSAAFLQLLSLRFHQIVSILLCRTMPLKYFETTFNHLNVCTRNDCNRSIITANLQEESSHHL
jgi:hypothetical protein